MTTQVSIETPEKRNHGSRVAKWNLRKSKRYTGAEK